MKRFAQFAASLFGAFGLLILLFSTNAFASSSSLDRTEGIHVKGSSMASCMHLRVNHTTYTCLDGYISKDTNVSPRTKFANFCGSALVIYWDANDQGPAICFTLSGEYDLTNYSAYFNGTPINWNDQASSYTTGCSYVTFYKDIQRRGTNVTVSPYVGKNFAPGAVPNDSLSSVYISSSC